MFVLTNGSSTFDTFVCSGIFDGLSMSTLVPSLRTTSYITLGDVAIISILNSLSILS